MLIFIPTHCIELRLARSTSEISGTAFYYLTRIKPVGRQFYPKLRCCKHDVWHFYFSKELSCYFCSLVVGFFVCFCYLLNLLLSLYFVDKLRLWIGFFKLILMFLTLFFFIVLPFQTGNCCITYSTWLGPIQHPPPGRNWQMLKGARPIGQHWHRTRISSKRWRTMTKPEQRGIGRNKSLVSKLTMSDSCTDCAKSVTRK